MHSNEYTLEQAIQRQFTTIHQRFCMPGHKGQLDPLDVTEAGDMDNLSHPQGALLAAHERCAKAYGAQAAHFCVNGSTGGVIAMLCSLPLEGKTVLLCADCHTSAASALIHCGAKPLMLPPRHRKDGVPLPSGVTDVANALEENPSVAAVFITSPNYYGFCADIPSIAALCHHKGIPLLVDAAHGAHFGFAASLPPQPKEADAWVVSAHKTLPVYNQGAIVFLGKNSLIEKRRLFDALATVQTTSPSWPLLCSLDNACLGLCRSAKEQYSELLLRIRRFERLLCGMPFEVISANDTEMKDPTRLVLSLKKQGVSGFMAAKHLQSEGILVEMADLHHLILICTPKDTEEDFLQLHEALLSMPFGNGCPGSLAQPPHGMLSVSPRCAAYGTMELCKLSQAKAHISARAICCYPPGVAIVLPGQTITQAQIDYLLSMEKAGAQLLNVEDGSIFVLA